MCFTELRKNLSIIKEELNLLNSQIIELEQRKIALLKKKRDLENIISSKSESNEEPNFEKTGVFLD